MSTLTQLNCGGNKIYSFIPYFDRIVFFLLCISYYKYKLKRMSQKLFLIELSTQSAQLSKCRFPLF